MRHSPVRVDKGAGDGTQPAPALLRSDEIIELSAVRRRRSSGRLFAWALLILALMALAIFWLIVGDPFDDVDA